jgi:ketosteroid isomerase-like protein
VVSEADVELMRQVCADWAGGNWRTAYAFDPEVVFARFGRPDFSEHLGEWRGIDAMSKAHLQWLDSWADVRYEAERFVDLGDRVLVLARQTGTGRRSGVPLDLEYGDIFTIRAGNILRWELYMDRADALAAAGLAG